MDAVPPLRHVASKTGPERRKGLVGVGVERSEDEVTEEIRWLQIKIISSLSLSCEVRGCVQSDMLCQLYQPADGEAWFLYICMESLPSHFNPGKIKLLTYETLCSLSGFQEGFSSQVEVSQSTSRKDMGMLDLEDSTGAALRHVLGSEQCPSLDLERSGERQVNSWWQLHMHMFHVTSENIHTGGALPQFIARLSTGVSRCSELYPTDPIAGGSPFVVKSG